MTTDSRYLLPPARDRYGRYLLPHPDTGTEQSWTRVTTLVKAVDDEQGLIKWSTAMGIKGATLRDDLRAQMSTLEYPRDRQAMYRVADDCKEAAATSAKANLGTALHRFTEQIDAADTTLDGIPTDWRPIIANYRDTLETADIQVHPSFIERITVAVEVGAAGTFDRIVRHEGRYYIADLKTGSIEYGGLTISAQLACYADGVRNVGLFNGDGWDPPFPVELDRGLVIHLPSDGSAPCELRWVDLDLGWEIARTAHKVRELRRIARKGAWL
jgi:hypothetical protein